MAEVGAFPLGHTAIEMCVSKLLYELSCGKSLEANRLQNYVAKSRLIHAVWCQDIDMLF
jgi:hypothetical protein